MIKGLKKGFGTVKKEIFGIGCKIGQTTVELDAKNLTTEQTPSRLICTCHRMGSQGWIGK